jgi:signal transduction histidine kinase
VEFHGGSIKIESSGRDKGTRCRIIIPVNRRG